MTTALNTGIIWKRLDFGIEVPYLWLRPDEEENADGFGDLEARFKFRFYDETEKIPALAVKIGVKTETGDANKDLGTGKVDFMVDFIAEKGVGRLTLYGNAGYNYRGDPAEEEEYDLVNLSVAGQFEVNEKFFLIAEISAEIATEDIDEDNPVEALLGARYKLPTETLLSAAVTAGLTDGAPDYKVTAGLTHEFL